MELSVNAADRYLRQRCINGKFQPMLQDLLNMSIAAHARKTLDLENVLAMANNFYLQILVI